MEELGYVNPLTKKHSIEKERILHWIKMGAQPTARIHNLLVSDKIITAPKITLFSKTKKAKAAEAATAKAAADAAAAPKVEAAPAEPAPEAPAPEAPKTEEKA